LNSKRVDFLISNLIIIGAIIIFILLINSIIITQFKINRDIFKVISIFLVILALFSYYLLSKPLLDLVFENENRLDNMIKEILHELNSPISTIQINTKMLQKTLLNEKEQKRLNRIEESCSNLISLYDEMEYLIKKNIDRIDDEIFELSELVKNCVKKFDDIKGDIKIKISIPQTKLICDKRGFEKVIDNLISNAIKYNKKDGLIEIKLKNSTLLIKDTGIGIDTKNLFIIYEKYYQADSSQKGFGLGLHIVKEYCDKYQIEIKIDSVEGEGSCFYLDLSKII